MVVTSAAFYHVYSFAMMTSDDAFGDPWAQDVENAVKIILKSDEKVAETRHSRIEENFCFDDSLTQKIW